MLYAAKEAYRSALTVQNYETERFRGILGRHRHQQEQRAISRVVNLLPPSSSFLDCPCGNGRWWPLLAAKASSIVGIDISEEMLRYARGKAAEIPIPVSLFRGEAEMIALPDNAVDYAFCHALTKHLPIPIQYAVLAEFARVARRGVVCSFGIFSHLTYEFWRRRGLSNSYPLLWEQLIEMASEAGLVPAEKFKCTTYLGVEHTVLFNVRAAAADKTVRLPCH